jgi:hypothetical protein
VLVRILMDGKIERASAISDAMELGCSALMVGYDLLRCVMWGASEARGEGECKI